MLRNLIHIKQEYEWDCGLACVRMVLQALGTLNEGNFQIACQQLGFGTNVWTIDLASVLTYFNAKYIFYTETFGVDMSYQNNSFYEDTFKVDEQRVKRLFSCAEDLNLKVKKRSIPLNDICSYINSGHLAVVLVNSNQLHCKWCRLTNRHQQLRYLVHKFKKDYCTYKDYAGHYVVVCGYNMEMKCFFYKDPSCKSALCCIPFREFEQAWHSYGTDSDIIFVNMEVTAKIGQE